MFAFLGNVLSCLSRNIHFKWSGKEQSILKAILHVSFHSGLIAVLQMQGDHPPCLRLRDVRVRIRCLISYITCICNLLQLTLEWLNWSCEMLHKILDFASFDPKLWSAVNEINKFTFFFVVCVVFWGLMGFESVLKFLASSLCDYKRDTASIFDNPPIPTASWICEPPELSRVGRHPASGNSKVGNNQGSVPKIIPIAWF